MRFHNTGLSSSVVGLTLVHVNVPPCVLSSQVLKVRLSLKRPYVGLGLKNVLEYKRGFTKALQYLLPQLEDEKGAKVTKNNITRQSRLVPALIFEVRKKLACTGFLPICAVRVPCFFSLGMGVMHVISCFFCMVVENFRTRAGLA